MRISLNSVSSGWNSVAHTHTHKLFRHPCVQVDAPRYHSQDVVTRQPDGDFFPCLFCCPQSYHIRSVSVPVRFDVRKNSFCEFCKIIQKLIRRLFGSTTVFFAIRHMDFIVNWCHFNIWLSAQCEFKFGFWYMWIAAHLFWIKCATSRSRRFRQGLKRQTWVTTHG